MKPLFVMVLTMTAVAALADKSGETSSHVPLFADDETVRVTIVAPFRDIKNSESDEEELPGQLIYLDDSGEEISLDIKIRARGKFRRERASCDMPPLRLNFRKSNKTLFAKSDKIKLVTHCRNRSGIFEQVVYKEYLAYRILNVLTDWSFRVRLVQVRYVEATNGKEIVEAPGFLIEDDKQLGKRIGMKRDDLPLTTVIALDGEYTNLGSLYQLLVGNTDFSPIKGPPGEDCCHNYLLYKNDSISISVPYDFDITGLVNPPYAKPNPRLGLRTVRHRLYRGRCINNRHLATNLQLFRNRKQEIFDLVNSVEGLSNSERKKATRYINDFYEIIESEKRVDKEIIKACLG